MIGLTSYLNHAKAQNKRLLEREGIIFYQAVENKIPQFVFFIPSRLDRNASLDKNLSDALSLQPTTCYIVYFQGIRWILPDLLERIQAMKTLDVFYNATPMKLGQGKITFDQTPGSWDEEIIMVDETYPINLRVKDSIYKLLVKELPNEEGVPTLFQLVD